VLKKPLVVSLHATPERLIQVRQNRLLSMGADIPNDEYIDRQAVTDEVAYARKLSAKFSWAQLDVTRRSIEETAAAVLKLFNLYSITTNQEAIRALFRVMNRHPQQRCRARNGADAMGHAATAEARRRTGHQHQERLAALASCVQPEPSPKRVT
jgi:hypothetical protein